MFECMLLPPTCVVYPPADEARHAGAGSGAVRGGEQAARGAQGIFGVPHVYSAGA